MENKRWTRSLVLKPKHRYMPRRGHLDLLYKVDVKLNPTKGWKPVDSTLDEYTSLLSSIMSFKGFETREDKQDVVGVMYSGGRGSTYLIINNLLEGKYVLPIYCVNNVDLEEIVWIKNLQLLQEKYGHILDPIRIDPSYCFGIGEHWSNGHVTRVFQNMVPYYLNSRFYDILSEIQFGYSEEDEYTQKMEDFDSLRKVLSNITGSKVPSLTTPLINMDKGFINRRLELYGENLCYSCTQLETKCWVNKRKKWILYSLEECGTNDCKFCKTNRKYSIAPKSIVVGFSYGSRPIDEFTLKKSKVLIEK